MPNHSSSPLSTGALDPSRCPELLAHANNRIQNLQHQIKSNGSNPLLSEILKGYMAWRQVLAHVQAKANFEK